jgi:hypothetical protein
MSETCVKVIYQPFSVLICCKTSKRDARASNSAIASLVYLSTVTIWGHGSFLSVLSHANARTSMNIV